MNKKKRFDNNKIYGDHFNVSPSKKLYEVFRNFFLSSKNWWLTKNNIKKYFEKNDFKNWIINNIPADSSISPVITWVGHSTFLIQISGINILTDPIFNTFLFFYPRNFPAGITLEKLPKIDFIIVSHNHSDHMEKKSIAYIIKRDNSTVLVPKGNKDWFLKKGFSNVYEKEWWTECSFNLKNENIKFSFLPAIHWSAESAFSVNRSLWGSWMIEFNNYKIYFAGDTAYSNHFKDIAKKFSSINIALMPIGPIYPRMTQKISHVDSYESVNAFIDLKAENFLPMHWGTFKLGSDNFLDPINQLKMAWSKKSKFLEDKKLNILKIGQKIKFDFPFDQIAKKPYGYELS
ncbi:MBL fold metallo-hydrolase [Candidatus Babeliales bacterium]|nr:MBL fold metallo-hydrolase [Candidatus Babeliales bacterium]